MLFAVEAAKRWAIDGIVANNNEALPQVEGQEGGVAEYALDPESATRLWDVSEKLLAG